MSRIEHVNLTVGDPEALSDLLQRIFDWRVRWDGPNRSGGRTIHVGANDHYLALCGAVGTTPPVHAKGRPLNHVAIEVDDLDAAQARARAAGLDPTDYDVYEPGRRFYFVEPNGVEFEVVSYTLAAAA